MSGNDSLFSIWQHPDKAAVANATNSQALLEYSEFCVSTINSVLGSIRRNLASSRWVADKKIQDRVISTTYINSFLIVIRMLIERGEDLEHEALAKKFAKIGQFNFSAYRSSQYQPDGRKDSGYIFRRKEGDLAPWASERRVTESSPSCFSLSRRLAQLNYKPKPALTPHFPADAGFPASLPAASVNVVSLKPVTIPPIDDAAVLAA